MVITGTHRTPSSKTDLARRPPNPPPELTLVKELKQKSAQRPVAETFSSVKLPNRVMSICKEAECQP
jgi:hypothetical protein